MYYKYDQILTYRFCFSPNFKCTHTVVSIHTIKLCRGSRSMALLGLNLSVRQRRCQYHALAALPPEKNTNTQRMSRPLSQSKTWRQEKCPAPDGIRTPDRPAHVLVTTLTTLSQLPLNRNQNLSILHTKKVVQRQLSTCFTNICDLCLTLMKYVLYVLRWLHITYGSTGILQIRITTINDKNLWNSVNLHEKFNYLLVSWTSVNWWWETKLFLLTGWKISVT
jgi:hypothetical protein